MMYIRDRTKALTMASSLYTPEQLMAGGRLDSQDVSVRCKCKM